jgi:hypothetical protein
MALFDHGFDLTPTLETGWLVPARPQTASCTCALWGAAILHEQVEEMAMLFSIVVFDNGQETAK